MNKKERVIAAIRHESVDYVPCGFSLHFPHDKAYGEAGVKSHLDFFKETDTDIIKIMNENLVPYVGELTSPAEYERLVRGFSMKSDFMQAQVDFTKAILDKADSTALSIGTLHGVTASSIHPIEKMGISYDKTREILVEYLREDPAKMQSAMQRITDVMCDLARTYIELGVDGVYYAALGAEKRYFTDEEFEKWIAPMDKQILAAIKEAGGYSFLHMCKDKLNMERYASYADLCDVANWGVYAAPYSLEEGRKLFKGKTIMGGLPDRHGVLVDGTDAEIEKAVKDTIGSFGKTGFILGADCTLATEQDMHKLSVAISACRSC